MYVSVQYNIVGETCEIYIFLRNEFMSEIDSFGTNFDHQ